MQIIPGHVSCELDQQRMRADAARASAARAVAVASGRGGWVRRLLRLKPSDRPSVVPPHAFRETGEDIYKAMRF